MNTFEIALKTKTLPTTAKDLSTLSFIGNRAVEFYAKQITFMKDVGMAQDQLEKTARDGQDAGIMLLEINKRLGEINSKLPPLKRKERDEILKTTNSKVCHLTKSSKRETARANKIGLKTHRQIQKARAVYDNPKEVQEVIKEARENDEIPTPLSVVNKVKYKKEKARRQKAEAKNTENKLVINIEEREYIQSLERCITILPSKPPKKWSEKGFRMAQGYAETLSKRLNVFNLKGVK